LKQEKAMRCSAIRKQLNRYLDAEVPAGLRDHVERHLAGCPECRRALAQLERLADVLEGADVPPVPEGFAARVMRQARAQTAQRPPAGWFEWNLLRWWREAAPAMRVAAATAIVVGLAAGLTMSGGLSRPVPASFPPRPEAGRDPIVQNFDFLGGIPAGSVEQTYLASVAEAPKK
jgi:anti-sigma factor RsiW